MQIEEEVQKLVQKDAESLMVSWERVMELMRHLKMEVLRFADKDRHMVRALVQGLGANARRT